MKHTYTVTGMTCNGCRNSVEEKLNSVSGVASAIVNLETSQAIIEMVSPIPMEMLKKALPEKYTITDNETVPKAVLLETQKSEWQLLFPLFLIFGYISVTAFLLNRNPFDSNGLMLDFMGLFYIVFSFFKMLDLKGFPASFRMYDPLAKHLFFYALIYPFIETALGIAFLMRFEVQSALIATIIILGITTIGVVKVLINKKSIQCACLGTALKLPMTKATLIENSVMIIMALLMLLDL